MERRNKTEVKTYTHRNGYVAKLYGISSMSIFLKEQEVFHTGFRTVHTEKEVMNFLENFPSFVEELNLVNLALL